MLLVVFYGEIMVSLVFAALEWWEEVVPRMDENRYLRNFRVPKTVMDEIISRGEKHPWIQVTANNVARAISVSKHVHMATWRLGLPYTTVRSFLVYRSS